MLPPPDEYDPDPVYECDNCHDETAEGCYLGDTESDWHCNACLSQHASLCEGCTQWWLEADFLPQALYCLKCTKHDDMREFRRLAKVYPKIVRLPRWMEKSR